MEINWFGSVVPKTLSIVDQIIDENLKEIYLFDDLLKIEIAVIYLTVNFGDPTSFFNLQSLN